MSHSRSFTWQDKVRLGFVNRAGEQKGVDSLIVTDMISPARNRAMADAVLRSGDEDLRVGVIQSWAPSSSTLHETQRQR
jgi:uncharacterized LabA/DUF88 family protein